jgi:hypothetical protein
MLSDRAASVGGRGLSEVDGLALERRLGIANLEAAKKGAARFAAGEGRAGRF